MLHTEEYELLPNIDDMSSFSSDSDLTRLSYLSECDIDEHMPQAINSRYCTVPELATINSTAKQLSILHTNIRSISLHRDEIVNLCVQTQKPLDVIGVSQTWNSVRSEIVADIDINSYKRYETTLLSQNGGVGIYVKTSLSSSKRDDLIIKWDGFETVWIEVKTGVLKILFCCIYRHPRSDMNTLTLHFNIILPLLTNKQAFIMGDFNLNSLNYDSHTPTFDFMNILFSNNFLPYITRPTRISNNSATIIDNMFTNLTNSKITSGNILTHISDHFPQFLILENANISHKKQKLLKREPLFKLQRRAIRAISHQPFLAHSLPIFKDLKLLRIVEIFKLKLLSFVYQSVSMVAPVCFQNCFFLNSTLHCHNTRQSTCGDLFLANINTSQYGLKSIQYLGAKLWNELPIAIRTSPLKFTFKKSLKFHFLNAM